MDALKTWNVYGVATVNPGKVIALAVSVNVNRKSIERVHKKDLPPIAGLSSTCQVLFSANLQAGKPPELSVFQIGKNEPDLIKIPEVHAAIIEVLQMIGDTL